MFCRHCGNELPDDARFCSNCGTKLDKKPSNLKKVFLPSRNVVSKDEAKKYILITAGVCVVLALIVWVVITFVIAPKYRGVSIEDYVNGKTSSTSESQQRIDKSQGESQKTNRLVESTPVEREEEGWSDTNEDGTPKPYLKDGSTNPDYFQDWFWINDMRESCKTDSSSFFKEYAVERILVDGYISTIETAGNNVIINLIAFDDDKGDYLYDFCVVCYLADSNDKMLQYIDDNNYCSVTGEIITDRSNDNCVYLAECYIYSVE